MNADRHSGASARSAMIGNWTRALVLAVVVSGMAAFVVPLTMSGPLRPSRISSDDAAAQRLAGSQSADVRQPPIVADYIRYSPKRKRQVAAYAARHYHDATWKLGVVRQIILHFTVSPTYSSTHQWFNSNTKSGGNAGTRKEFPGGCTHFVIDKNGIIYQQVPLTIMCRHTVGLNNRTIGIEFVERTSAANILRRPRQFRAGQALVRWLQATYGIANRDVIGHSMANQSKFFVDYENWINDHEDWQPSQVRRFRKGL